MTLLDEFGLLGGQGGKMQKEAGKVDDNRHVSSFFLHLARHVASASSIPIESLPLSTGQ